MTFEEWWDENGKEICENTSTQKHIAWAAWIAAKEQTLDEMEKHDEQTRD